MKQFKINVQIKKDKNQRSFLEHTSPENMVWHAISLATLVNWVLQGDKILSLRLLHLCGSHVGIFTAFSHNLIFNANLLLQTNSTL